MNQIFHKMRKITIITTIITAIIFSGCGQINREASDTNSKKSDKSKQEKVILTDTEFKTYEELGIMVGNPPSKEKQVTKANWIHPPYNRWSYQNIRKILPTAPLGFGKTPVPLKKEISKILDNKFSIEGEFYGIDEIMKHTYGDALLVVHNGIIIGERYENSMTESQPHVFFSMTKSYTGTIMQLLIDEGKLEKSNLVEDYIVELKGSDYGSATVDQILNMEAGFYGKEDMSDPESPVIKMAEAMGSLPTASTNGIFDYLPKLKKTEEHGTAFRYVSTTTEVAGWLISKATGKGYDEVLREKIWAKLGTEDEGYLMVDNKGKGLSTGGGVGSARDLAKFGHMIINDGMINGVQVVPKHIIEKMRDKGNSEKWELGDFADMEGFTYNSYWYQTNNNEGVFLAMGIHGQFLYLNPDKNLVIVKFASQPLTEDPEKDLIWWYVFNQIAERL